MLLRLPTSVMAHASGFLPAREALRLACACRGVRGLVAHVWVPRFQVPAELATHRDRAQRLARMLRFRIGIVYLSPAWSVDDVAKLFHYLQLQRDGARQSA